MMKINLKSLLAGLLMACTGFVIGYLASMPDILSRCPADDLDYINRSAVCGEVEAIDKSGYVAFRSSLVAFIESEKRAGRVDEVSYYFRDLKNGPVFGINEYDGFIPASLLKLPLALAYMNSEEEDPGILKKEIRFEAGQSIPSQIHSVSEPLKPGQSYSVEELLSRMLAYSDNASAYLLFDNLDRLSGKPAGFIQTYRELGITNPDDPLSEDVTVRGYASIFRVLYNASYLNAELADKILGWLSQSTFTEGIVSGLPSDITVAHKFGERVIVDNSGAEIDGGKQLHDCGVVYYPENPYTICVMTRGDDWEGLKRVISSISRRTYEEVHSRRR